MDTTERAIVEHLAKNHLVRTKDLIALLLERYFKEADVQEALKALEKACHISRIRPLGEENLALTKLGLQEAAKKNMF